MATLHIRGMRKETKAASHGGRVLARIFLWWRFCGAAPGVGVEEASAPGAAGPCLAKSYHGRHMPLCWDCGARSRSLPLAGALERKRGAPKARREALRPGLDRGHHSGPWRGAVHAAWRMLDAFRWCWVVMQDTD